MLTRSVRAAIAAASAIGLVEIPYSMKWCSVSHTLSKPSASVSNIWANSR